MNINPIEKKKNKNKSGGAGFQAFGLMPALFRAIKAKGYNLPTPI